MCCDSGSVRNRNKPGYMRGTPSILEYRETRSQSRGADNPQGRPVDETGTLRDCTPGSDAQASDDDTVHAPWRHGEHVNKVSVGEPADGSPPKERHQQFGGLGKVERASASRSRTSNPLLFWILCDAPCLLISSMGSISRRSQRAQWSHPRMSG